MTPKTSPYISKSLRERIEASGKTAAELIEFGLAALEALTATEEGLGPVVITRERGPESCRHPLPRRDRKSGLCNACGTNVTGRTT